MFLSWVWFRGDFARQNHEHTRHEGLQVAGYGYRLLPANPDMARSLPACGDDLSLYCRYVRRRARLGAREGRQPDAYVHHALSGEPGAEPPGGSDLDGVRGGSLPRLSGGQPALLLGRDHIKVGTVARIYCVCFRVRLSVPRDGPLRDRLEDGDKELLADIYRKDAHHLGVPGVPGINGWAHRGRAFPGGNHGQHYSLCHLQALRQGVQEDRRVLRRCVARAGYALAEPAQSRLFRHFIAVVGVVTGAREQRCWEHAIALGPVVDSRLRGNDVWEGLPACPQPGCDPLGTSPCEYRCKKREKPHRRGERMPRLRGRLCHRFAGSTL